MSNLVKIFQRGPPELQAQPPDHGPHRKIFTEASFRSKRSDVRDDFLVLAVAQTVVS